MWQLIFLYPNFNCSVPLLTNLSLSICPPVFVSMLFQPTVSKSFSPLINSFKGGVTFLSPYWSSVSDVRSVGRLQQAFLLQRWAFRDSWIIPSLNIPSAVKYNMYSRRFLVNHLVRHPDSFGTDDIQTVENIKIESSVDNGGFCNSWKHLLTLKSRVWQP